MRSLLPAFLLVLAVPGLAQDRAATERRLEALRTQIQGVEQQVSQARSEEENALGALEGLQTEIQLREQLVAGYRLHLDSLRGETSALRRSIQRLDGEIRSARESYRQYARHAYMRGRASDLALILSAGSIPQMIARARYLRQFADRRRRQVARIETKTVELRGRERELQYAHQQTQQLLTTSQYEQTELTERRRQRESLVADARQRRGQLERELAQRQADAQALEGLVRDLVAAERRREEEARRVAEAEAARRREEEARRASAAAVRPVSPRPTHTAPTPPSPAAEPERSEPLPPAADRPVSLAGSFQANRGRLPWPADGTLTGAFGTRTDPVYGTRTDSPGIDITTAPGAGVRAVFAGTVEAINVMPTYGTFVMVSHGGYHTFYANLSSVGVRKGQQVRAGEAIGRAGTSQQSRGPGLFFAIFEGERQVNPSPWLRSR
ncbi:MAG: peptidoglycan DD-metalloendopeptidase family protein [Rubricoccaceae bacterium]|nr:peptidoglycan DD-metalloendopeptidase family protein [Rubricoccaceae bacterium]